MMQRRWPCTNTVDGSQRPIDVDFSRGEWHTFPNDEWVPESSKLSVGQWYAENFKKTKLQGRYPAQQFYDAGIGLYDGSFAYHTLDGDANGGVYQPEWYFWPLVEQAGHADFWKFAAMGMDVVSQVHAFLISCLLLIRWRN